MVDWCRRWSISSLQWGEVVNAFVVTSIGRPEDGIGDVTANQLGDGFNHTFFGANDQLIDDI
jgi:hypothetical protein